MYKGPELGESMWSRVRKKPSLAEGSGVREKFNSQTVLFRNT